MKITVNKFSFSFQNVTDAEIGSIQAALDFSPLAQHRELGKQFRRALSEARWHKTKGEHKGQSRVSGKSWIYPEEIWADTDLVGDTEPHEGWQRYVKYERPGGEVCH